MYICSTNTEIMTLHHTSTNANIVKITKLFTIYTKIMKAVYTFTVGQTRYTSRVAIRIAKKVNEKFAKSNTLRTFAVRTGWNLFDYSQDIFHTVNTVPFLRRFYFDRFDRFAKLQGRGTLFCISIPQIFSRMRTGKNLTAYAQGAFASTPAARKPASYIRPILAKFITFTCGSIPRPRHCGILPPIFHVHMDCYLAVKTKD